MERKKISLQTSDDQKPQQVQPADNEKAVIDLLFGFPSEAPTSLVDGNGEIGDVDTLAQVLNYSSFGMTRVCTSPEDS